MAASGFAGLGYQIVWTQQSALWLGHESAAVLAITAAFFAGLAVGAFALGPRIERSARPARWYAGCEAAIALWSTLLLWLVAPASDALLTITGVQPSAAWQWTVAFAGCFVLLLPATAAMGATLPAMERTLAAFEGQGRTVAILYAANTAGAVFGVLAAALWLVPAIGLRATAAVCIALNAVCAAAAFFVFDTAPSTPGASRSPALRIALLLAATGLLGIGYETLVVRVISQVAEDTVYTFALLLAVYLVGTTCGAAAWAGLRRIGSGSLLVVTALACGAALPGLWGAEVLRDAIQHAAGDGLAAAITAEAALAVAAFLLPTIAMGALFAQLCSAAAESGTSFARCLGANTLGAALAPFVFGVVLLPALGAKAGLVLIVLGYLALAWRRIALPWIAAPAVAALALAVFAPPLVFVDVPDGGRVLGYDEGVAAAVSVVEDAQGVARLRINNRQQEGSSATAFVDGRQALLPLLLHAAPKRALFLGLGTGVTARAATFDPALQVDAVELLPEVIDASQYFGHALPEGVNESHLHTRPADARRFVRAAADRYDLVVADNFHPARSGSGALYTVEHFRAVRERLEPGGLFVQWLPLHQLDLPTLAVIVRSFIEVFPGAQALIASNSLDTPVLGLVAHAEDGARFDLERVRTRVAASRWATRFGIEDEFALLGSFVAGPRALQRFAAEAELNTDDRPLVAYRAPRVTYAPMRDAHAAPRDRLLALLRLLTIEPGELITADVPWSQRLAAYWTARTDYLDAGRRVRPSADVREMLAQVREPLLAVLRVSPDFRPAYDPLLHMAQALAARDAAAARALLSDLQSAQPARVEAAAALQRLNADL
jgi:spermidine synthase